jgi:hypothetical protein
MTYQPLTSGMMLVYCGITYVRRKQTGTLVEPVKEIAKKGKAIPVTGHGGPYGCETLRVPYI